MSPTDHLRVLIAFCDTTTSHKYLAERLRSVVGDIDLAEKVYRTGSTLRDRLTASVGGALPPGVGLNMSAPSGNLTDAVGELPQAPKPDPKNWSTIVGQRLLVNCGGSSPHETVLLEVSPGEVYGKFVRTNPRWIPLRDWAVIEILSQENRG